MKTKLMLVLTLLAGSVAAGPRISIGLGFGPGYYPPPPPPRHSRISRCPGPGYSWVDGYWYPQGRRYAWRPGQWLRPPQARSYWMAPRYDRGHFHQGYWRR